MSGSVSSGRTSGSASSGRTKRTSNVTSKTKGDWRADIASARPMMPPPRNKDKSIYSIESTKTNPRATKGAANATTQTEVTSKNKILEKEKNISAGIDTNTVRFSKAVDMETGMSAYLSNSEAAISTGSEKKEKNGGKEKAEDVETGMAAYLNPPHGGKNTGDESSSRSEKKEKRIGSSNDRDSNNVGNDKTADDELRAMKQKAMDGPVRIHENDRIRKEPQLDKKLMSSRKPTLNTKEISIKDYYKEKEDDLLAVKKKEAYNHRVALDEGELVKEETRQNTMKMPTPPVSGKNTKSGGAKEINLKEYYEKDGDEIQDRRRATVITGPTSPLERSPLPPMKRGNTWSGPEFKPAPDSPRGRGQSVASMSSMSAISGLTGFTSAGALVPPSLTEQPRFVQPGATRVNGNTETRVTDDTVTVATTTTKPYSQRTMLVEAELVQTTDPEKGSSGKIETTSDTDSAEGAQDAVCAPATNSNIRLYNLMNRMNFRVPSIAVSAKPIPPSSRQDMLERQDTMEVVRSSKRIRRYLCYFCIILICIIIIIIIVSVNIGRNLGSQEAAED